METQHIRLIRAIAEHRSISAAAREIGLSQPALTKILSRVEDFVGDRLFDRQSRGVTLSSGGALFLERTERVEREMLSLRADMQALRAGLAGSVAVGVGQFWIGQVVPRVVNRLRAEAPGVQVRIATGTRDQLLHLLQLGEIDLMLGRFAEDLPEAMSGEALADVRLFLTVRRDHPLTRLPRIVTPGDLRPYGWVLPPSADPTALHMASVFRARFGGPVPPAVEAVSQNVVVSLLLGSDLVTVMPGIAMNGPPTGLVRLATDWLAWSRSAGVIRIAEKRLMACGERFLDLLRDEMGRQRQG